MIAVIGCMCAFMPVIADDEEDKNLHEYKIKIAFIYNFLKFVDWPGDNAPKKTNTATVCILGDRAFSNYFRDLQNTHKQDLTITITDSIPGNNVSACHVLFVGKDDEDNASSFLASARHRPVLTISEAKDFADMGGIIEIVKVGKNVGLFSKDRINLRINLKAAEASNLNIDARLLQIAAEVIK